MDPEEVGEILKEHFASVITEWKDMGDGKIREGYVDILEYVNIKKELVLLTTGKVPEDWGVANAVPLFKKDNRDKPGHIERTVLFCLPKYRKDMETLERMQKRFTKMLPGLECISYKQ
eukprot:g42442.t1